MVPHEGGAEDTHNAMRQKNAGQKCHKSNDKVGWQKIFCLFGNIGGEDGSHHKADDGAIFCGDGVEGAALEAMGSESGGNVWFAAGKNGRFFPAHQGFSGLLPVGVIKTQAVGIINNNQNKNR